MLQVLQHMSTHIPWLSSATDLGAGLEVVKDVLQAVWQGEGGGYPRSQEAALSFRWPRIVTCLFTCLLCTLPASRHSMPYSPPGRTRWTGPCDAHAT